MIKKKPSITLYRNADYVKNILEYYKQIQINFTVKHSTYNTVVETDLNIQKFITHEFDNKVFYAFSMIQADLKTSPNLEKVLQGQWKKTNYDSQNGLPNLKYKSCINLDITSAYPYCLYLHKLISEKTFNYLMKLPKNERLPAIGMTAKKHTIINYEKGQAKDWNFHEYKYANVFYFVINQITDLMEWAKDIAGSDFLFYWVDGIFLKPSIPKSKIAEIEAIFREQGYYYKFEKVENISLERKHDMIEINMLKKGEPKQYRFVDRNLAKNFYNILKNLANAENPLHLHGNTVRDMELSEGISESDFDEWME